ncbi:hypothetical protein D7030_13035 [Flavobacteriaceae bacterium AU392]|nr:hypothetical protein D1817_05455 [Flavobacteriaceae bacterium]RKM81230.1 hypothetical protein D7030_13035 [Flavobacteriaceae bacterium AU392]
MNKTLNILISSVWLINGLFCKVLNLVPRHQEIVSKILESEYSKEFTFIIGILEILMSLWILSKYKSKINTIMQIILILSMNIIELIYVPELLLWGRFNVMFALMFILIVYLNEFKLNKMKN